MSFNSDSVSPVSACDVSSGDAGRFVVARGGGFGFAGGADGIAAAAGCGPGVGLVLSGLVRMPQPASSAMPISGIERSKRQHFTTPPNHKSVARTDAVTCLRATNLPELPNGNFLHTPFS